MIVKCPKCEERKKRIRATAAKAKQRAKHKIRASINAMRR